MRWLYTSDGDDDEDSDDDATREAVPGATGGVCFGCTDAGGVLVATFKAER